MTDTVLAIKARLTVTAVVSAMPSCTWPRVTGFGLHTSKCERGLDDSGNTKHLEISPLDFHQDILFPIFPLQRNPTSSHRYRAITMADNFTNKILV